MDSRYEAYCFADRLFYEVPRHLDNDEGSLSAAVPSIAESSWTQHDLGGWRVFLPPSGDLPQRRQGWKIHVSGTPANARRLVATVSEYCLTHNIPFKFLRTEKILLARNSKYASRAASGKLATIYPASDSDFERILTELDEKLSGEPGPYILSDLRYGDGPLYVRYGGFVERWTANERGEQVAAIERPDGVLVPDERRPGFHVPDWVTLPEFLSPHVAARRGGSAADLPYRVSGAIHFSNGGGVYLATRRSDGQRAVLKEARPHAGLDADGTDAVARLDREHQALCRLDGVPGLPRVLDRFTAWEHHFLALSQLPGVPLGPWLAGNYPLTQPHATSADLAAYTERALRVAEGIERVVGAVHERGLVFGDLHNRNVLVDEHDQVSLVDFELAFPVQTGRRPGLGAPGFVAPADRHGFAIDDYALAALRLWLFLPMNTMLSLAPDKLPEYLHFVRERFVLPADYLDRIEHTLRPAPAPLVDEPAERVTGAGWPVDQAAAAASLAAPDWSGARKSMVAAILASATPQRADRLFPGDIEQFSSGGTTLGYGAAGVLHALAATGAGRFPEHENWLVRAVRTAPPRRPGLYDGAHGVACVLADFGHDEPANALVEEFTPLVADVRDHGLHGGLAGIGLALTHLADVWSRPECADRALAVGDRLASALATAAGPGSTARAGLLHGWSGPALLFVHLFRRTGDRAWLDLADRALLRELQECQRRDDGRLQVRDGTVRTLPYLEVGSAGIAVVAEELAACAPDAASAAELPALRRSLLAEYVAQSGLWLGRAGLIGALALSLRRHPDPEAERGLARHLARLGLHAVNYRGELAFPGNQLLRLSMDLATGTAGVLLAVSAAVDDRVPFLPFLGERHPSADAPIASAPGTDRTGQPAGRNR